MERTGRYRLVRQLGQGGMAEVLEGVSEGEGGFKRRVAIKRILPHLSSDAAVGRMFLDEARIASHLHHASIVAVLDYGTLDGVPFQVLEFVDGLDLERLARLAEERNMALPVGLVLHVITQVAHALEHAHTARDEHGEPLGIVHRDVSPANVLVSWDGHVKLSDFGIALAKNRLERTQHDGIKGKLEYMSPEQATRGSVDARSDVFALGCTLHRLLAGESPLSDLSALTRLVAGEELTLDRGLDPALAGVIRKATQSARALRQSSAGEFAAELGALVPQYLQGEPTGALRAFLSGLRASPTAPKRGALDALLGLELVLAEDTSETRSFSSRTLPAEPLAATRPDQPVPQTRDRSRWRVGLLGALVLSAAGLAVAWPRAPVPTNAARGSLERAGSEVSPASPVGRELARAEPASPAPVDSGLPANEAVANVPAADEGLPQQGIEKPALVNDAAPGPSVVRTPLTRESSARKQRPKREDSTQTQPAPAVQPAPASAGRGTLLIGGVRAHRAEIRVDGRSMGFAPKRLELPAGSHRVELVQPDGTLIGPRSIELDARHTQSAPARWMVE